jgi:hypothetical protein
MGRYDGPPPQMTVLYKIISANKTPPEAQNWARRGEKAKDDKSLIPEKTATLKGKFRIEIWYIKLDTLTHNILHRRIPKVFN